MGSMLKSSPVNWNIDETSKQSIYLHFLIQYTSIDEDENFHCVRPNWRTFPEAEN